MEVDFFLRNAMDPCLGRSDSSEYLFALFLNVRRHTAPFDDSKNFRQIAMGLFVVSLDDHAGPRNSALEHFRDFQMNGRNSKPRQRLSQSSRAQAGIDQGAKDHISAGPGKTVKISG